MEKYSEIVGLPVISNDNGKKMGTVTNILFCNAMKKVLAFLIETNNYQSCKQLILLKDILKIGPDAIIAKNISSVIKLDEWKKNEGFQENSQITGLKVYSLEGQYLGIVKDVLFDCNVGKIDCIEISDGLFQDIFKGRSILPLFGKVEFSEENILVDRESIEEIRKTGGGLNNILNIK